MKKQPEDARQYEAPLANAIRDYMLISRVDERGRDTDRHNKAAHALCDLLIRWYFAEYRSEEQTRTEQICH